ncbi:MAG: ABC transporter permease [Bacteroidaceae bacterium]|nr:ABC transporter permease [Bacteroidaceae bacterium]
MNLSLYIAKRYLFSKKSHQVINIISGVAIAGIALATAAMVCVLSVFNGFQGVVTKQFTAFDPDIKITASSGKVITTDAPEILQVAAMPSLAVVSYGIEDKAMVEYGNKQAMVTIKGVDEAFTSLTDIHRILHGPGEFTLNDGENFYAVPGGELADKLSFSTFSNTPLKVYAPNRKGAINLTVPARNFKKGELYSSGLVFVLNQPEYDGEYIITSESFARKIFRREDNEATSMEIKVRAGEDAEDVKEAIEETLGDGYVVQNRYEQQESIYKVMQIEKLISYIFLTFILAVACFNIIGSLAMLIIEKRDNMNTLRSMGAENKTIANIFVFEGGIISAIGAGIGVVLGILLCLAQQEFGLIPMGSSEGFVVDSYPMEIAWRDVAMVFVTVIVVGFVTVWLPVKALTKRYT